MNPYEAYMKEIAQPMRDELTGRSFEDLTTPEGVDQFMDSLAPEETAFVVINSVCGCAAGLARPAAVTVAEQNPIRPDRKATVFAGQDKEATEHVREKAPEYLPSSPSFALFKDGKIVDMIERHEIEGHETMSVITNLQAWFEEHGKEI